MATMEERKWREEAYKGIKAICEFLGYKVIYLPKKDASLVGATIAEGDGKPKRIEIYHKDQCEKTMTLVHELAHALQHEYLEELPTDREPFAYTFGRYVSALIGIDNEATTNNYLYSDIAEDDHHALQQGFGGLVRHKLFNDLYVSLRRPGKKVQNQYISTHHSLEDADYSKFVLGDLDLMKEILANQELLLTCIEFANKVKEQKARKRKKTSITPVSSRDKR